MSFCMLRKKPLVCREVAVYVLFLSAACMRRGTPHQNTSRLTMADNFENPRTSSHKEGLLIVTACRKEMEKDHQLRPVSPQFRI